MQSFKKTYISGLLTPRPNWMLKRLLLAALLLLPCFLISTLVAQTANAPIMFPKYQVLGVVYAPPGSASNVTYGNSQMVGSASTIITNTSSEEVLSTSYTTGFTLYGFGSSSTFTTSDNWLTANSTSTSYSVQTTTGNAVTTMGPVSSALGVNHDNDIIYIWLNPVVIANVTNSKAPYTLNWDGLQFNSCDLTDTSDQVNFYQLMNGCDSLQYPYPDIIGIPVWCLKNPYFPGQSCAQWQPFISRSWDTNPWGTDPNGVGLGPGLNINDLADILAADPFITQTLVPSTNIVGSYCHPTYGVNVDPNDTEVIPNPTTFPAPKSGTWAANTCGTTGATMARFTPYDTVQYPVPGPNGEPQTYTGTFVYSTTSATGKTASQTNTHSTNASDTGGFGYTGTYGGAGPVASGFNFSLTESDGFSYTTSNSNTTTTTSSSTSSASYSITGPQASDNYTGPVVFDVYTDNVYGTFAFYSNEQRQQPPIQLSLVAGQAPITANTPTNFGSAMVGSSSASQTIELTNNSPYPMTMVGPALTFTDPGFQIVPGLDFCSNVQLQPNGTTPFSCQITIEFTPVLSDAPNSIQASYPINAYMIAAGTENISSWQNILVSSTNLLVSATATPNTADTVGGTITPSTVEFAAENASSPTLQTQVLTFKNYYSSPVTISGATATAGSGFTLSDKTDYSISPDSCSGKTVASLGTCSFTLRYEPVGLPTLTVLSSKITIYGSTQGAITFAGASGPITSTTISVTPSFNMTCYITQNEISGSCSASTALTLTNNGNVSVVLGTPTGTNGFAGIASGTVAAGASVGVSVNAGPVCNNGPGGNCTFTGTVTFPGTAQTGGSGTAVSTSSSGSLMEIFCPSPCIPPDSVVKVTGAEQNATTTTPATPGTGSVALSGKVKSGFTGKRELTLTVGKFNAKVFYDSTATTNEVAEAMAEAANAKGSPMTAKVRGETVTFTSVVKGKAGNLAYDITGTTDFSASPAKGALSGGAAEQTTKKYDAGTAEAAVGKDAVSVDWGKGSTPESIANDLATALNKVSKGSYSAKASGGTVTIAMTKSGSKPAESVKVKDTMGFKPSSFTAGVK